MDQWTKFDQKMMHRAIVLARRGKAWVAPNPMVGAVLIRDGEIIGEGYHRRYGGPHAEVNAITIADSKAKGADLYVNLEPCCHYGKTPPCVDLIIRSKIKRVVVAIEDPNPQVNGQGIKILRDAGVEVEVGLEAEQARELNQPYLKKASTGIPWVTLKIAQSIDGRIASKTGHSQWITCKESRKHAHMMRAIHDAVLVGSETVIADDPMLNVRHVHGRNPVRIVLDTNFKIPADSQLLNTPKSAPTWIYGAPGNGRAPSWKGNNNVRVIRLSQDNHGKVNLHELISDLAKNGIMSLMVEGGSGIWTSFLCEDLVDKVEIIIAPLIIGGGVEAIRDLNILQVDDAVKLQPFRWRKVGTDLHVVARVVHEGRKECLPV